MKRDPLLYDEPEEKEIWLLTYADMVTLLMAIFITMLSISTVDPNKFEEIAAVMTRESVKIERQRPLNEVKQKLDELIRSANLSHKVKVEKTARGLDIRFTSSVFFSEGQAELLPEAKAILSKAMRPLALILPKVKEIQVEGHTDDTPIRSFKFDSNWELSTNRATSVVRFLIAHKIPHDICRAEGLAATRPLVPNRDARGKPIEVNQAQNRRVVIKIIVN